MRLIGLDLGSRTLGVAISDELGMLAHAYDTFRFHDDDYESAIKYTIEVCEKENVKEVVLGYPKHMNGDSGIRASISVSFKEELEKRAGLKVYLEDERLTTIIVDKAMIAGNMRREKRRQKKDEMAAVVILQGYLDRKAF
ncbi:MAG: Holliday junction resolvase RuvX [Acholeplasmatales bacterium]|nr:Holliday junction resolvase RuvX [Acholeplasmatales bacterium]